MEKQQHSKRTRAHLLKCGKSGRCTGRDETQLKPLRPRFPFAMECGFESCKSFSRPLHCFEHGFLQFGMCCALVYERSRKPVSQSRDGDGATLASFGRYKGRCSKTSSR